VQFRKWSEKVFGEKMSFKSLVEDGQ